GGRPKLWRGCAGRPTRGCRATRSSRRTRSSTACAATRSSAPSSEIPRLGGNASSRPSERREHLLVVLRKWRGDVDAELLDDDPLGVQKRPRDGGGRPPPRPF